MRNKKDKYANRMYMFQKVIEIGDQTVLDANDIDEEIKKQYSSF